MVSPESITADVPSRIALAMSVASARVGSGCSIIDSSIWVAVITSLPWAPARRITSFWISGTRVHAGFDAQVAARDHDAVGDVDDLVSAS